jgi:hypothetical protein
MHSAYNSVYADSRKAEFSPRFDYWGTRRWSSFTFVDATCKISIPNEQTGNVGGMTLQSKNERGKMRTK